MSQESHVRSLVLGDPAYLSLKSYLLQSTGLHYYEDKDAELAEVIAPNMAAAGCTDCASYLARLSVHPSSDAELARITQALTIGETYFFRHSEQFEALRNVIVPELLASGSARRLRVWSAGCAIGAEPYSVSIMLRREYPVDLADWDVEILGTDINAGYLELAEAGIFGEWAFRTTDPAFRASCFTKAGRNWKIRPEYKEWVSFRRHNLAAGQPAPVKPPVFTFDLILCRNVLIYFNEETSHRILMGFHDQLRPGGWLMLGHAESGAARNSPFEAIQYPGTTLYRKPGETQPRPALWDASPFVSMPRPEPLPPPAPTPVDSTEALWSRLEVLLRNKDWAEAVKICGEALDRETLNPYLHLFQGILAAAMSQPVVAEQSLRRAIYLDRTFIPAHYHLGVTLMQAGNQPEAARSFRNVQKLVAKQEAEQLDRQVAGMTVREMETETGALLQSLGAV